MQDLTKKPLVVVVGATATGKSQLAIKLAMELGMEIISADSRLIYKGMDIGTAKPSEKDLAKVKHHMINVISPAESFNVGDYKKQTESLLAIADQKDSRSNVILVGGTGLYIKAVLYGLWNGPPADMKLRNFLFMLEKNRKGSLYDQLTEIDPVVSSRIHPHDLPKIIRALEVFYLTGRTISSSHAQHRFQESTRDFLIIGLRMDRETLYQRIDQRVDEMIERGWVDEVKRLLENGIHEHLPSMKSLGYNIICSYLRERISLDDAIKLIKRDTRHYAKRQLTWFTKDENVQWVEWNGINLTQNSFNQIKQFTNRAETAVWI